MEQKYDLAIVGAGIAGSLIASKVHDLHPNWSILLVEKDSSPGGRLRKTDRTSGLWSYGLNAISPNLYEFLDQSLKVDPESPCLESLCNPYRSSLGMLATKDDLYRY